MSHPDELSKGPVASSTEDIAEANANQTNVEAKKAQELARTGGRAKENPIAEMMDEGHVVGHPGGQLRGDQSEGHRGGSQRQGQNRGRD